MSSFNTRFYCAYCQHVTPGDAYWQGNIKPCEKCGRHATNINPRLQEVGDVAQQFGWAHCPPELLKRTDGR